MINERNGKWNYEKWEERESGIMKNERNGRVELWKIRGTGEWNYEKWEERESGIMKN